MKESHKLELKNLIYACKKEREEYVQQSAAISSFKKECLINYLSHLEVESLGIIETAKSFKKAKILIKEKFYEDFSLTIIVHGL